MMDTRPPAPLGKQNRKAWLLGLRDEDFWRTTEEVRLALSSALVTRDDARTIPQEEREDMMRWLSYSRLPPFRDPQGRQGGPSYRDSPSWLFSVGGVQIQPEDDHWIGNYYGRRVGRVRSWIQVVIDGPDEKWTWTVRQLKHIRVLYPPG